MLKRGSLIDLIGIYENAADFSEFYDVLGKNLELFEKQTLLPLDPLIKKAYQSLKQGLNNLTSVSKSFYSPSTHERKVMGAVYTKKSVCRFINYQAIFHYSLSKGKNGFELNLDNENGIPRLKLLDPACGVGFFLLDVFFLILLTLSNDLYEKRRDLQKIENEGDLRKIAFVLMEKVIHGVDIDELAINNAQIVFKSIALYLMLGYPHEKVNDVGNSITYLRIQDAIDTNIHTTNFLLMDKNEYKEKFDMIIGNPPYIRIHKMDPILNKHLRDNFYVPVKDFDIYICFFEQAVILLKPKGVIAFITPDKYLLRQYAYKLRQFLLEHVQIREIIDISRCKDVFEAGIYPVITLLIKNPADSAINSSEIQGVYIRIEDNFLDKKIETTSIIEKIFQRIKIDDVHNNSVEIAMITEQTLTKFKKNPLYEFNFIVNNNQQLLEDLFSSYQTLGDMADSILIFCGTPRAKDYHQLDQNIYDNFEPKHNNDLKYIVSHNILPFLIIWGVGINSIGHKYIQPYYKVQGGTEDKSGFGNQIIERFKIKPKILVKANSKRLTAAIDLEGFAANGIYGIILNQDIFRSIGIEDPNFGPNLLISILNSDLINYFIINKFRSYMLNSSYLSVNSSILRSVPIPLLKGPIERDLHKFPIDNVVETSNRGRIAQISSSVQIISHTYNEITEAFRSIIAESYASSKKDQQEELESKYSILFQLLNGVKIENIDTQILDKVKNQNIVKKMMLVSQLNQEINQEMFKLFNIPLSLQLEIKNFFYGVKS